MNVVPTPTLFHPQCLVTKRADEKHGPYVDLLRDFDLDHQGRMYVSRHAVETMAQMLGMPSTLQFEAMELAVLEADAEIERLKEELESLREFERAATYTVEHMGQKVRKKPGRKPANDKEPAHA